MKVNMIIEKEKKNFEIEEGSTVLDAIKKYGLKGESEFLLAEIDGKYKSLSTIITNEIDEVKLHDCKNQAANIAYQNTLLLIYKYAIYKLFGNLNVRMENTLSDGVFTVIEGYGEIDKEVAKRITETMQEIVDKNFVITVKEVWGKGGKEELENQNIKYVNDFIENANEEFPLKYCDINGFKNVVYSELMPYTGMVNKFELNPYKEGLIVRGPDDKKGFELDEFEPEENLYKTFSQENKWSNMLRINDIEELNKKIRSGEIKDDILLAEALHQQRIIEITDDIINKRSKIILLAGPSSSGKTTTSKRLILQLRVNGFETMYIGTDDYFCERHEHPKDEHGEYDFDRGLENMDVPLFEKHIEDLLVGKEADIPTYDFGIGSKIFGKRICKLKENQLIIIEGIHALNNNILQNISEDEKFKIYISPLTQINIDENNRVSTRDNRLIRRMIRDYHHRSYTPDKTIKSWPKVRDGEERNVFPGNKEADVILNTTLIYELGILKKHIEPMLMEVKKGCDEYAEARRILEFIRRVEIIEDETPISNASLLREFIGGSVFQ